MDYYALFHTGQNSLPDIHLGNYRNLHTIFLISKNQEDKDYAGVFPFSSTSLKTSPIISTGIE